MGRQHLVIICGIPGAGKSTLARHVVDRWGAVGFESVTFADEFGAAGRTSSGDLTEQAMAHAYAAMGTAVTGSFATSRLVLAVGSFRTEDQRGRLRDIARGTGAGVTTLRIVSPTETAAERVRSRIAHGGNGPTEKAIRQIDAELRRASDIDVVLTNDTSIEHFHCRADTMIEFLLWSLDHNPRAPTVFVGRFEELAACELVLTRDFIELERRRMAPSTRNEIVMSIERELQRSRNRIRELRNCLLLGLSGSIESNIETALQKATDTWVNAVDRLGRLNY